jgi:hypothetical protein
VTYVKGKRKKSFSGFPKGSFEIKEIKAFRFSLTRAASGSSRCPAGQTQRNSEVSKENPEQASRKMFAAGGKGELPCKDRFSYTSGSGTGGILPSSAPFLILVAIFRNITPCGQEKPFRHGEVAQGEGHVHDTGIWGEIFRAHLGKSKGAFDDVADMFSSETDF